MKRRPMLKLIALTPFFVFMKVARASPPARPADKLTHATTLLQTSPVRGHRYHDGPKIINRLRRGDQLTLISEPENPYDEFAVRVEWHGKKLGYLPRENNHRVSRMLRGLTREGRQVKPGAVHAVVREIDRKTEHWQPVMIDVLATTSTKASIRSGTSEQD